MQARWLILVMAAYATSGMAQNTVYESKQPDGTSVFSDTPSPGAKAVELPPLSVIKTDPLPPQAEPVPSADADTKANANAAPPYTSIAFASPADQDSVYTNDGSFNITLRIEPNLRADNGDRIRVKLDGKLLANSYGSTNIVVSEADWQDAATSDNIQHSLQAAVIDKQGQVLIESKPVTFYAHRATVNRAAPR